MGDTFYCTASGGPWNGHDRLSCCTGSIRTPDKAAIDIAALGLNYLLQGPCPYPELSTHLDYPTAILP
jgi:hypothetical protein